jgi:hypothetical protein
VSRVNWKRQVAVAARWLHIYGSMMSLALVLFFSATGITLNHPEWFAGQEHLVEASGTMNPSWLTGDDTTVDRLSVVEFLRSTHHITGAVSDFRLDDVDATVAFKGPGYSADAFVDRTSGAYTLSETRFGLVAVMNDLHKGRDSGGVWKAVIDVAAGLLLFVSLTGLALLYFLKKYWTAGLILLGAGALASYAVVLVWVP